MRERERERERDHALKLAVEKGEGRRRGPRVKEPIQYFCRKDASKRQAVAVGRSDGRSRLVGGGEDLSFRGPLRESDGEREREREKRPLIKLSNNADPLFIKVS